MFSMRFLIILTSLLMAAGCSTGTPAVAEASSPTPTSGDCPQVRKTPTAPANFQKLKNPFPDSMEAYKMGEAMFLSTAKPFPCKVCHGAKGDGQGEPDFESTPPARNFTCAATMNALSDGQLFWIIENGSPNTAMPAYQGNLAESDIWSVITYIRSLAR